MSLCDPWEACAAAAREGFTDSSAGRFEASVQDDGIGFDEDQAGWGTGLQNMRTRALEIEGTLLVSRAPGGGTRVVLVVPYETADQVRLRHRRALTLSIVFGLAAMSSSVRLFTHGLAFSNTFILFFALAFVHNLLMYRQLRQRPRHQSGRSTRS